MSKKIYATDMSLGIYMSQRLSWSYVPEVAPHGPCQPLLVVQNVLQLALVLEEGALARHSKAHLVWIEALFGLFATFLGHLGSCAAHVCLLCLRLFGALPAFASFLVGCERHCRDLGRIFRQTCVFLVVPIVQPIEMRVAVHKLFLGFVAID